MATEMMRNYAVEASDLLTRWKRGEDVQDALAHQLRHVSAGLNTLQAEAKAEAAIKKLTEDLVFSQRANRDGHEAFVASDQSTVREVLTHIERLKDRIQNPQYHAH